MGQLEGRRRQILRVVIDDYIVTAEPVGSEAARQRHGLEISSATVRNEMAALEELGYLHQPHHSAGRVPTDQGYRVYVDSMVDAEQVSPSERLRIRRTLAATEFDQAVEQAARALAVVTECASVVASPKLPQQVVRHLHLIPLTLRRAMAVIMTDAEVFEGKTVEFEQPVSAEECDRLSQEISRRIAGRPLSDLTDRVLATVIGEAAHYQRVLDQIGRLLRERIQRSPARVHTEGQANILKQPEFQDARRAQPVLSVLEQGEAAAELLGDDAGEERGVRVMIGAENRRDEMRDCAVVAATYYVADRPAGVLGIVGPTRMRYGRVISLVRFLADSLGDTLEQF
jgi:heat-inducible transcriptional repressor